MSSPFTRAIDAALPHLYEAKRCLSTDRIAREEFVDGRLEGLIEDLEREATSSDREEGS